MKINHNIAALKANIQLNKSDSSMSKSLEKLTSGLKINHASDDPAGMAISRKMKAQLKGLEKASANASDGISVIQTAEGALEEVSSCLQRMNELAVQAANGIYTTEDRNAIQLEIDQLNEEIQRISETTEFNTKKLLDGSIDRKSYTDNLNVKIIAIADEVAASDKYQITVNNDARQAVVMGHTLDTNIELSSKIFDTTDVDKEAVISVNGQTIKITDSDTYNSVYEKMRDLCSSIDINCFVTNISDDGTNVTPLNTDPTNVASAGYEVATLGQLDNNDPNPAQAFVFVSEQFGSDQKVTVSCNNKVIAERLGIYDETQLSDAGEPATTIEGKGIDADVTVTIVDDNAFAKTATVFADGEVVRVTDNSGFEIKFEVSSTTAGTKYIDMQGGSGKDKEFLPEVVPGSSTVTDVRITVLEAGEMSLHIGANAYQTMEVAIPKVTPKTLGVDIVNIRTIEGAEKAIDLVNEAIIDLSTIRAKLGAYENRLEHAICNLDAANENMTESLSRIEDTDMAAEMANYTQYSVLVQAGTSMLAQANELPQNILSLLQ